MSLDLTGVALADLMAAAGFGPPALPANPSTAQIAAYNTAVAEQAAAFSVILTYLVNNVVVATTDSVSVPAAGILDHTGAACTGTATGTGTGTGTIS